MKIIEMIDVSKEYPQTRGSINVLENINLSIEKGDFVALMGPSGSGKTTLLNIIGFLLKPSYGKYLFEGKDYSSASEEVLNENRKRIGFVFQFFHLLPMLNVKKNVELSAVIAGMKKSERERKAVELIEYVGLGKRAEDKVVNLSRGEMQRVAIARALINEPSLILADEPTASVDSENRENIMDLFERVNKEGGTTIVLATHDEYVANKCKEIFYLRNGRLAYKR
ncbi:MAG: ABC transporter ATP-binding protein [Candidatus Bathyarchaeia archaeon]